VPTAVVILSIRIMRFLIHAVWPDDGAQHVRAVVHDSATGVI